MSGDVNASNSAGGPVQTFEDFSRDQEVLKKQGEEREAKAAAEAEEKVRKDAETRVRMAKEEKERVLNQTREALKALFGAAKVFLFIGLVLFLLLTWSVGDIFANLIEGLSDGTDWYFSPGIAGNFLSFILVSFISWYLFVRLFVGNKLVLVTSFTLLLCVSFVGQFLTKNTKLIESYMCGDSPTVGFYLSANNVGKYTGLGCIKVTPELILSADAVTKRMVPKKLSLTTTASLKSLVLSQNGLPKVFVGQRKDDQGLYVLYDNPGLGTDSTPEYVNLLRPAKTSDVEHNIGLLKERERREQEAFEAKKLAEEKRLKTLQLEEEKKIKSQERSQAPNSTPFIFVYLGREPQKTVMVFNEGEIITARGDLMVQATKPCNSKIKLNHQRSFYTGCEIQDKGLTFKEGESFYFSGGGTIQVFAKRG